MRSLRDIKLEARRKLHEGMRVSALYIAPGSDPLPVSVRIHEKWGALGDMAGTNLHYAEREDVQPRIIFLVEEVPSPMQHAIVSVAPGEAYRVHNTLPVENITITATVVRLSASQAAGHPVPAGA